MAHGYDLNLLGSTDDEGGALDYFIALQLYEGDQGGVLGRTNKAEFRDRKPYCVTSFTRSGLILTVSNLGPLASPVVYIDYQLRYCTLSSHGPADGFTVEHAEGFAPDPMDKYLTAATIPAYDTLTQHIPLANYGPPVCNIYFRARVATLWDEDLPPEQWNFAEDRKVVEAHQSFPAA